MGLKENIGAMKELIYGMSKDLEKTNKGNRAAAQRVRTASVEFAKVAKEFRKESVLMSGKLKKMIKTAKKRY